MLPSTEKKKNVYSTRTLMLDVKYFNYIILNLSDLKNGHAICNMDHALKSENYL